MHVVRAQMETMHAVSHITNAIHSKLPLSMGIERYSSRCESGTWQVIDRSICINGSTSAAAN